MIKKIIITNIYPYYGGPLVLSTLCKTLRQLGYDARLLMLPGFVVKPHNKTKYRIQILKYCLNNYIKEMLRGIKHEESEEPSSVSMDGLKFQHFPFFSRKESIVVYPANVYGNPLNGKNVVKWLIQFFYHENDHNAYKDDELFIAFREVFNSKKVNPDNNLAHFSYFDHNLYKQYNYSKRKERCYVLRKGKSRSDVPQSFDGPVYDNNMTQRQLVKMFNDYKFCYFYDTQTFYTTIACVCGCIPIIVMEKGKTINDYIKQDDCRFGIAFGDSPDEIAYAIKTRDKLIESINYEERNKINARNMIGIMEKRFGMISKMN